MKTGEPADVHVLIPVLKRPERVAPLRASLLASWGAHRCIPCWIVGEHDDVERDALDATGDRVVVLPGLREPGDYARKMNAAAALCRQRFPDDWMFLGSDDLCFCPRWADIAIEAAGDTFQVVGTNDLGNPSVTAGLHSTHSLVRCSYVGTVDDPELLLHEGYRHNWVDNEFVGTARSRGVYVHAHDSWVEHLHPHWGKGEIDATYELGLGDYNADAILYRQREHLWL